MATVELEWRESSMDRGVETHRCELEARRDGESLVMEAHDWGRAIFRHVSATVYYWVEDSQRRIPLYDDEGFGDLDDAKEALAEWYLQNAPTLLVTLTA